MVLLLSQPQLHWLVSLLCCLLHRTVSFWRAWTLPFKTLYPQCLMEDLAYIKKALTSSWMEWINDWMNKGKQKEWKADPFGEKEVLLHSDGRFFLFPTIRRRKELRQNCSSWKMSPSIWVRAKSLGEAASLHLRQCVRASGDVNRLTSKDSSLQKMYSPTISPKHEGRWDYNTVNIISFSHQKCDITQIIRRLP